MTNAVNYTLYQAGWLACVFGAAWGRPWAGAAAGAATLLVHVLLSRRPADELVLAATVGALGIAVESAQIAAGTLSFDSGLIAPWLPPVWLVMLWMQFAGTLRFSMRWLSGAALPAALFGALGGPLAYFAVSRLGIVHLHPRIWPSLLVLSCLWAAAIPVAAAAARRRPGVGAYRFSG